ncbi:MAG TPA: glycosyl transferase [Pseudolabrys sp.]|nr:glycosyl transferase [Pseudolabrys sp.]
MRTLAALVPGATAGLIAEAVVVDAGAGGDSEEIADIAGCRYLRSAAPQGARLKAAAETTRTPWLMFLRAGCVPEPGWIAAAERFMQAADLAGGAGRAAVFRPPSVNDLLRPGWGELVNLLRVACGGAPKPEQGLLIAKKLYLALGGHPDGADADAALLRKLGRRRIAMLPAVASAAG